MKKKLLMLYQKLKVEIDELKGKAERAKRDSKFEEAASIEYGQIPELEEKIKENEEKWSRMQETWYTYYETLLMKMQLQV